MAEIGAADPRAIPPWAGRADKAAVAALARRVIAAAREGDGVARGLLRAQAAELAAHAEALAARLEPWPEAIPVVFHGGALNAPAYAAAVEAALERSARRFQVRPSRADGVAGALLQARRLASPAAAS
jgi:N-acetylglucosamine kinase-like BadF-type ATPase